MIKKIMFTGIALFFNLQLFAQGQSSLYKLESEVKKTIEKAYQASVRISMYDAVNGKAGGGTFSGVVIDTAGYVLSVAHAVKPDALYEIVFPNGKKLLARGLGAMPSNDAAVLKITTKDTWPYAPMGWSSSLQPNMPCISISYPYTVASKTPNIRFGYIAEPLAKNGYIRSTCLMEPGDSGGPLFDMKGRVVGLHSRVEVPLDSNFEVPIDLYRKYWQALIQPRSYIEMPAEIIVPKDPEAASLRSLSGISLINASFDQTLAKRLAATSLKLTSPSNRKGVTSNMLGTLVQLDGLTDKNKSFIVAKSSLVGDIVWVALTPNQLFPAKVLHRDAANDLVLLQLNRKIKGGVDLKAVADEPVSVQNVGKFLASPRPNDSPLMSVISNIGVDIAKVKGNAHIGVGTKMVDGKLIIATLFPGGPASRASLITGDALLSINGKPITKEEDFINELETYAVKDTAVIEVLREGTQFEKKVAVRMATDPSAAHLAYQFKDGYSVRRGDFSKVLVHDGRLKPAECGGPLYGIDGTFYGINIARFSRTSTLTIPAVIVRKFVKSALDKFAVTTALN